MSVVHSRLEDKDIKTLDQLARTRGATRSRLIREAVEMYVAAWTGEPSIHDIQKRVNKLEEQINLINSILRIEEKKNGL